MRVWVVQRCIQYEGSEVVEICASEEVAIREARKLVEETVKAWDWMELKYSHTITVNPEGNNLHRWDDASLDIYFLIYSVEVKT